MGETSWYYDPKFYAAIAAALLAGNVQARVVFNDNARFIEVKLSDGSKTLWTNSRSGEESQTQGWGFNRISPEGDLVVVHLSRTVSLVSEVEEVARLIATYDYGSDVDLITPADLLDLLEEAWGVIANAGNGDWNSETELWREAAVQWRDRYHIVLSSSLDTETLDTEGSEVEG